MVIMWVSKHSPTPRQRDELVRIFGDHRLDVDQNPFSDASEIAARIRERNAREIVCVAPLSVLRKLLEFGLQPLTAEMSQVPPDQAEVVVDGRNGRRFYKFVKFKRLTGIEMTYAEVTPCNTTGDD